MRSFSFIGASALISLATTVEGKHDVHGNLEAIHRRHRQEREFARRANETLIKRGTCAFPISDGLVAVTPGSTNGGWALPPDQPCTPGKYCPYACPPNQVSMQWDPSVTSYAYPGSMNGGLLCNSDGSLTKPIPNQPYCQSTASNIGVTNTCGQNVAFCQTVLPGMEDMLIPTDVTSWAALAVPGPSYWAGTAAHYYINPPGVSSADGCVWGSTANPYGNWAPYVAGANLDASGSTYIKLGWNPIYLEQATPFRNQMPTWGVRIECPNGGCNGVPCSIDPSQNQVNGMTGSSSIGAGGASFCVVTVSPGSTANFVVFQGAGTGNANGWSNVAAAAAVASASSNSTTSSVQAGQFYQTGQSSGQATATSTTASNVTVSSSTTSLSSQQWLASGYSVSATFAETQYDLFDASSTAATRATGEPTSVNVVAESTSTTSALIAKHTGAASNIQASLAVVLLGIGAMLL